MACFSFMRRSKSDAATGRLSELDDELLGIRANLYSYKELKVATNDFSPANKIGEGGFGCVYKGKLKSGQMAAIKVMSADSRQGVREFLNEIQAISDIEHENLVKLYGCCVEGNERILVYNYLRNNSLSETLLGENCSKLKFTWETRVKICIGVARGLAYLHQEVRPHIVHRDIKAANILLGDDLTPKISDFGLAKFIPANTTHVSTRVAGTIGYLAPEYAIRGKLTRRADVYSFGVLLIEIITGRCNTNTLLSADECHILEKAWKLFKKRELVKLVDASLGSNFVAEQACRFLKIGLICVQFNPELRPMMSTVVCLLYGARNVDDIRITKPGLISDFMDLNIRGAPQPSSLANTTTSTCSSSGCDTFNSKTFISVPSSQATMTFTSVYNSR